MVAPAVKVLGLVINEMAHLTYHVGSNSSPTCDQFRIAFPFTNFMETMSPAAIATVFDVSLTVVEVVAAELAVKA